jgi:hypothetical protein
MQMPSWWLVGLGNTGHQNRVGITVTVTVTVNGFPAVENLSALLTLKSVMGGSLQGQLAAAA